MGLIVRVGVARAESSLESQHSGRPRQNNHKFEPHLDRERFSETLGENRQCESDLR